MGQKNIIGVLNIEREVLEENDPERCQGIIGNDAGQCRYRQIADSEFCDLHSGHRNETKKNKIEYTLAGYTERTKTQTGRTAVINLRDEIAILRMSLEERLNSCNNQIDVLAATPMILETIRTINTAVTSCHKLEISLGEVLGRDRLLAFADKVINLLVEADLEPEQVSHISDKLMEDFTD